MGFGAQPELWLRNGTYWGTETARPNGEGDHTSRRDVGHHHVPVRRGTRLKLGRPAGGVQAGWQTSSGRLPVADRAQSGCKTADMAAKRRG